MIWTGYAVLLYTILRNSACMKPENWWDCPYSLLMIFDVILVSWVSVNSDDSRCIVSFWKLRVFRCSASLPQGEYVYKSNWRVVIFNRKINAITSHQWFVVLAAMDKTKQYYLGTTMKHRDHVEKCCTNHYWKVVHYSTCYPIQSDRTREACSCQVVSKHFSVYGPQILAQCEEARCDWRWCGCWGEMGWTYKLYRWNGSDSQDCFFYCFGNFSIYHHPAMHRVSLNFQQLDPYAIGDGPIPYSPCVWVYVVRCVILLGPARTRKWRLSTGLAVFLGRWGDGVGGESIAFGLLARIFIHVPKKILVTPEISTIKYQHLVEAEQWSWSTPSKIIACSVVRRMGLEHRWGLVS